METTATEATAAAVPIAPPDPAPYQRQSGDLKSQLAALGAKITSEDVFQEVAKIATDAKTLDSAIEKAIEPSKTAAHKAHRAVCDLEMKLRAPLKDVMSAARTMIGSWEIEQRKIREEEEKKLAAEAKARAEEAQIQEAIEHDEAGDKESAAEVLDRPVIAPPVSLPKPKAAGVATATVREVTILDASKLKREFLIPDEKRIKAAGKALTQEMADHLFGAGAVQVADVPQVRFRA